MTVSDKIRALDAAGCSRAEIARLLGRRYQHVRNVLEADRVRGNSEPAGMAEEGATFLPASPSPYGPDVQPRGRGAYRLVVRADGSIVLPRELREAFGVVVGGVVMARHEGDEFKLVSAATALRRIQKVLEPYAQEGVSWADELIAERRREVEREEKGG
ncbi:MAG TPA: AbrB/MazE/SpoVT family DNA-binding domain-containing protein [Phenylobacterium sp.]|uniref:AbrB/MazE/SpoVT family DNA-binding domain-containing protein n=1 Tax=Phenylobacterium sp. TaxID=1871053 RepID=UPI002B46F608|nr:AbrB/MazE/SpoVT family DNA-binding domain-containing protein [Phenylobacterium sp.]HKR90106.1 AbrB/MazE/SpoVT family DNA-binding domain-containing protein [Phenylobacterium sp.]